MIKTTLNDTFTKKEVERINGMLHKNDAIHQNCRCTFASSNAIFFVYFYNKKPVGFLSYTNYLPDENYIKINFIFINKKYRHRGIAGILRSDLIEFVKNEDNIKRIETLSKGKPEMYQKYGFQISQTRKAQPPYKVYELNLI